MSLAIIEHNGKTLDIDVGKDIPIPSSIKSSTRKSLFLGVAAIEDLPYWKSIGALFYPIKLVAHSNMSIPQDCHAMGVYLPNKVAKHRCRTHALDAITDATPDVIVDTTSNTVDSSNSSSNPCRNTRSKPRKSIANLSIQNNIDITPLYITPLYKPNPFHYEPNPFHYELPYATIGSSLLTTPLPNSTRLLTCPSYDEENHCYLKERSLMLYNSRFMPDDLYLMYDYIVTMWLGKLYG